MTASPTRVGHYKADADAVDVYIGRGEDGACLTDTPVHDRGWLGNPYTLEDRTRLESIRPFKEKFREVLRDSKLHRNAVRDLHGQTLGCWCRTLDEEEPACHGDVIAGWADRLHRLDAGYDDTDHGRRLAAYTESGELTHEQAKTVIVGALATRDYENRLSARELAGRCMGVSASTVRDLVAEVRREHNLAVYSRGSGYWHIQSEDEFEDALERIDEQIATKEQTKRELARAFNRNRVIGQ